VTLVNWNGSTIFGPGSEWFWSMAQFAVVAVTLFAIYRQVRAQGSSNALQRLNALDDKWASDRMLRSRLSLVQAIRAGHSDIASLPMLGIVGNFYEGLGALHRDGHMPTRDVLENWNRRIQFWWAVLAPAIQELRAIDNDPLGLELFEGLNALARDYDRRLGQSIDIDGATRASWVDEEVVRTTLLLRMDQESKAGVVPTGPPTAAGADTLKRDPDM